MTRGGISPVKIYLFLEPYAEYGEPLKNGTETLQKQPIKE